MNTVLELKKYLLSISTVVVLLLYLGAGLTWAIQKLVVPDQFQSDLIQEASEKELPLNEKGYKKALTYANEHKRDWVYLDDAGKQRYIYENFYINKYETLFAYKNSVNQEKLATQESTLTEGEEKRFALIDQRIKDLSFVREYDAEGFLDALRTIWNSYLLFTPLLFASIYAVDKHYISALLASASQSGTPYLRAKVKTCLLLGTLFYWLPLLALLIFYMARTNFLAELSLPYYYISPLSSWPVNIGQGLGWLAVSGFIEYLYLILIIILISQSTFSLLTASLASFFYSGGAFFILSWLTPFYDRSPLIRIIVTTWALSPAGALSSVVRHDYFYPTNFLNLPILKDYNLPLLCSTLLMIPVIFLLYRNRRSCFQGNGTSHKWDISNAVKALINNHST